MDQFANRRIYGRKAPEPARTAYGVPQEYIDAMPKELSNVAISTLYADRVDPEYATRLTPDRNVYDIVLLWRTQITADYALAFNDRRDLTVFDILDMWEDGVAAEFATLT